MKHYNYPYLNDAEFLYKIHTQQIQQQYIKITSLNWAEEPLQEIQGIVQSGSLNLNGSSAVRRNGNISIFLEDLSNDIISYKNLDSVFAINKKVYIEIGIKNNSTKYLDYPIIWFPQGVFIIFAPSVSYSRGGITINLTLKDKMSLLNGELAGTLPASIVFHEYDTVGPNNEIIKKRPAVYTIVEELVHHYGGEDLTRIFIDFPLVVKRVLKWTNTQPLYIKENYVNGRPSYSIVSSAGENVKSYKSGTPIGYIYQTFYYPTDLISNIGETVCTILDKIKSTFGNYEYFYDVDGNFVFQEIKNYLLTSKVTDNLNELQFQDYLIPKNYSKTVKTIDDSQIISLNATPQYNMIKNDFTIWGERSILGDSTNKIPIRYRLVIDTKPTIGNIYTCVAYTNQDTKFTELSVPTYYNSRDQFPAQGVEERFYVNKANNSIYKWAYNKSTKVYEYMLESTARLIKIKTTDWRTELYLNDLENAPTSNISSYYADLQAEWPKIYDFLKNPYPNSSNVEYYQGGFRTSDEIDYSALNYFLDFIDDAEVSIFSVNNIGRRPLVKKIENVNCVFEPKVPNIFYAFGDDIQEIKELYNKEQINYIELSKDSSALNYIEKYDGVFSAFEEMKVQLYQQLSYNQTINLSIIPAYDIEPNTRIKLETALGGLSGDYIIDTVTVPFDYQGAMSITAKQALERF